MRSFPIVMTVTGYSAPLMIRTIRISNKRCQIQIRAKPDCAPHRTTVSTSNARSDNSKINSAMCQFSGVNGICQSGQNNKTGSPTAVESMRNGHVSAPTALSNRESFDFVRQARFRQRESLHGPFMGEVLKLIAQAYAA